GIKTLQNELKSGKTYCLLGSSGVGKTTLLNKLLGEELFEVNDAQIPVSPQNSGNTRIAGIRNNTCLERVITVAGRAFPIA
ncbi:MAG: GTPase RsgA, partial [Acidobacteria bacterium]|nr:GTPase RsgA [Acidobacteriota bacterium]